MQPSPRLSNRERQALQLLLEGKSNKLIARDLNVTERTVEFHLNNIYSKFQVNSRLELVLKLKNEPNLLEAENLGYSTVANRSILAQNGDEPDSTNWVTSLRAAGSEVGRELSMKVSSTLNTGSETNPTTFHGAIVTCLTKYAEFNGRAARPEFWWFALFVTLGAAAFTLLSETLGSIFLLAFLLPLLAAGSRRLRDSGKSAWWLLFLLVPVGGIVTLGILWAMPSSDSEPEESTPSD